MRFFICEFQNYTFHKSLQIFFRVGSDLNIFYCVSNTKGSETSSCNLQVPLLMIIHTIYTIVIVHSLLVSRSHLSRNAD